MNTNNNFKVEKYKDGKFFIFHTEKIDPPVKGLPPSTSHFIIMDKEEIPELINLLNDYHNNANKK